eukprot:GSA120T00024520001.1
MVRRGNGGAATPCPRPSLRLQLRPCPRPCRPAGGPYPQSSAWIDDGDRTGRPLPVNFGPRPFPL